MILKSNHLSLAFKAGIAAVRARSVRRAAKDHAKIAALRSELRWHGQSRASRRSTPTYNTWCMMKQRCQNSKALDYGRYGGRGIKVCERWQKFENFLADMGERPLGKTLDRYPNNNGNYEPGNCRWATPAEQAVNRCKPDSKSYPRRRKSGVKI